MLAVIPSLQSCGDKRTWVTRMAVCAEIVSGNIVDQVLERLLIARLLALAHCAGHDQILSKDDACFCFVVIDRKGPDRLDLW